MSDSLITIVAIFLAAILMFVFPLASISEMNDSETLALVQAYTTEFVNRIKSRGKIYRIFCAVFLQYEIALYSTVKCRAFKQFTGCVQ